MTRSRTTRLTRDGTGMCCGQVMHGLPLKQCARQSANVQALSHFPSTSQMGTPRIVWPRLCSTAPRAPSMQVMWTRWADAGKVGSRAMSVAASNNCGVRPFSPTTTPSKERRPSPTRYDHENPPLRKTPTPAVVAHLRALCSVARCLVSPTTEGGSHAEAEEFCDGHSGVGAGGGRERHPVVARRHFDTDHEAEEWSPSPS